MTAAHCHYSYVSESLISEIFENIHQGHSAIVLGHRYSGKSYLVKVLMERLSAAGFAVESMRFPEDSSDILPENRFAELREKHRERKSWILVASEVDLLQHSSARRLLEEIRSEGDQGRLQAIVTGQFDLRELIHGPKSELTNADHYVLQGLDPVLAANFAANFIQGLSLPPDSQNDVQRELWRLSGGNTFLIRSVLSATIEYRNRNGIRNTPTTAFELRESVAPPYALDALCAYLIEYAVRLIDGDPGCWNKLQELLKNRSTSLKPRGKPGGGLTLSGVAIRQQDQLHFASELMERLTRQRFDSRRVADLYARAGQWDEAFRRYATLDPKLNVRPYNRDDRSDVAAAVEALSATLYAEAAKGVETVRQRFVQGCRWLLGFPEVSFWMRGQTWSHDPSDSSSLSAEAESAASAALPLGGSPEPSLLPLPSPWTYCGVAAILDAVRSEHRGAVLIGDFEGREPLSREREELATKLLSHFMSAHSHAVAVERAEQRLGTRDRHAEIVNSILDAMGSHMLDVGHIIDRAASSLRQLGYRRVLFCLVDGERKRIQGVRDDSDYPLVNVAEKFNYDLTETTKDIQPYVVSTGKAIIVEDAVNEPLANNGTTSFAIVPIKERDGLVIGTIHVERVDGLAPAKEEVADLELFARQLSMAIQHSDRVQLIQSTLDHIPDPILIVDPQEQVRYANDAAARLFEVERKWHAPSPLPAGSVLGDAALEALKSGNYFCHVDKLAGKEYKGDLNAQRIENWRGDCTGAFLYVHDLNDFYQVVRVLGHVAEATDPVSAINLLLEAAKLLGHPWARVYFVDLEDESVLRSEKGYGFDGEDNFNQRKTTLTPATTPGTRGWLSITAGKPMLFCFDPAVKEGTEDKTFLGIPMLRVSVQDSDPVLRKADGQCWLDFPLVTTEGKRLGKVTLGCDQNFSRQEFEVLSVLSDWVAGILDAFRERESIVKERHRWIVEAAQLSMANMAHNLNTRFSSLALLLARYRLRKGNHLDLNEEFAGAYDSLAAVALDAKTKLGVVRLRPEFLDIAEMLKTVFAANLQEDQWSLFASPGEARIEGDSRLLEEVFCEFIYNAKKAIEFSDRLKMEVSVEILQDSIHIDICDNGPGVPYENKDKIFDNFFYTYTESNREGQGLGLYRTKRVIEAHGGRIAETGVPGEGACFSIHLPFRVLRPVITSNAEVTHV